MNPAYIKAVPVRKTDVNDTYTELGSHSLAHNDQPDRRRRHLINQLEHLGYQVELTPAA